MPGPLSDNQTALSFFQALFRVRQFPFAHAGLAE